MLHLESLGAMTVACRLMPEFHKDAPRLILGDFSQFDEARPSLARQLANSKLARSKQSVTFLSRTVSEMTTTSKILIADDNLQNCELLDAYLADEDYEIAMAHDGRDTLNKVAEFQPDLILLDIMMPKLSGYEVCKQLRADEKTRNIPVLMVTALAEMGDIERAVQAGADDFLTKPVNRLELTTRVKSLLRVRHLTSQRDRLLAYLEEVDASAVKTLGLK